MHDDDSWIKRLSVLIKQADQKNKRIVASCFGHQLVAKTFGGEVGYNESGWMIGHYSLEISRHYDWMGELTEQTGLYHFNQQRVTRLPRAAQSFAASEDYPDFAYTLGDNIFCLQGHPEQPRRAMDNFLAATVDQMDQSAIKKARAKIDDGEPDSRLWGEWMMRFFMA